MLTGHTFTSCGVTGRVGPTLQQMRAAYATVWDDQYLSEGLFQGYQDWTVPVSGDYKFDVRGASGYRDSTGLGNVGRGARITGTISLNKGEVITIVVGQSGAAPSSGQPGGSGGGTFVVRKSGNIPLIVAGGGSANTNSTADADRQGKDGRLTERGGTGRVNTFASDGFGGPASGGFSAGGGGFSGKGSDSSRAGGGGGFFGGLTAPLANSIQAGNSSGAGGFGGGGNGDSTSVQSGGAGGYSGGSGSQTTTSSYAGGGGGSFISTDVTLVGTSNGTYEELAVFPAINGTSITNLNSYNFGDGSVSVTLVNEFSTGNTLHPTAQDAEENTNAIAIAPAGSSYHSLVPISYDIQNDLIHSPSPHGYENNQAVAFEFLDPSPADIVEGTIYYIDVINDYSYRLNNDPAVNLTRPTTRSLQDVARRIVVNPQTNEFNIPNHGFNPDQPLRYSSGGGSAIAPLISGQTFYVSEVLDADRFKLKVGLDSTESIDITSAGTGTEHSFIFLTVNFDSNSLYVPDHGLISGQKVIYLNNGGTSVTGLTNDQVYYVLKIDDSTIKLSSSPNLAIGNIVNLTDVGTGTHSLAVQSIDYASDTITLPDHGFRDGELVEYNSRGQTVISGLDSSQQYYVILIDKDNIKLASSAENAESDIAINLLSTPIGVGRHTLTSLTQTPDGVYEITGTPGDNTFVVQARGQVSNLFKAINPRSVVNIELDALYIEAHGFITGTKVSYDAGNDGTAIGGLTDNTDYYVVVINQDYFKLATSLVNAQSGVTVSLTNFGTGLAHSLTTNQLNGRIVGSGNVSVAAGSVLVDGVGTSFSKILKAGDTFTLYPPSEINQLIFADTNVNTSNNRIEIAHNFVSGDIVTFSSGGGVPPLPLINNYYYYVGVIDENNIQIYTSKSASLIGSGFITFSTSGTGSSFTLTKTIPTTPIVRAITAIGSDTQITVGRPYAQAYTSVDYAYPTFIYVRPSGYSIHRPFDGGVEMSTGAENSYGQMIRQTRKYFRYQSGKGIQTSFAINFKPSIDVEFLEKFSVSGNSTTIICKTRRPHNLLTGRTIEMNEAYNSQGNLSTVYNGSFQITKLDDLTFTFAVAGIIADGPEARAYGFPQFHVTSWQNGAIRSGMFDFQNGMFFEFDGQKVYCVRRSSTQQTAGTVSALRGSELVFGEGTRFTTQFESGDSIVMRGQTYKVIDIENDTRMSVRPEYRGSTGLEIEFNPATSVDVANDQFNINRHGLSDRLPVVYNSIDGEQIGGLINGTTYYVDLIDADSFRLYPAPDSETRVDLSGVGTTTVHSFVPAKSGIIITKTVDTKIPQEEWNIDRCDGTGPSGYNLDLSRIQMCYMDYSWYGAGKIRFGFKTNDGLVRYVHEFKHNNVLFESYFRSGNLPARYEVVTGLNPTYIPSLFHWGTSVIMDGTFDDDRGYLFTAGSQTLNIEGTTTKSFAGDGINLSNDLITSLSHGFRTGDIVQFQSIAADGNPGLNSQNPTTQVIGNQTLSTLTNTSRYKVFVNSPDLIHLTPQNATITNGATVSRSGTTVTIVTAENHNIPVTGNNNVGIYGLYNSSGAVISGIPEFYVGPVTRTNDTTITFPVATGAGSLVNITNTVLATNVVTITTSGAHGFLAGQTVLVSGTNNAVYNGTYVIATVPTSTTFTYARTNANITSAASSGTVARIIDATSAPGAVISEIVNFTSQGNIQYTYFLHPEGSLNNTTGPNYQPLISLRLSPSVDSGLTGKLGDRDIINRMQVRMQEIGVSTNGLVEVKLILNGRLNNLAFKGVPQPSLIELVEHTVRDTISGGVQVYNFQAEGGGAGTNASTSVDIDQLFELSNSILGGDNIFPDGPDILTVVVSRLTGDVTRTSAKLSWSEAQA